MHRAQISFYVSVDAWYFWVRIQRDSESGAFQTTITLRYISGALDTYLKYNNSR